MGAHVVHTIFRGNGIEAETYKEVRKYWCRTIIFSWTIVNLPYKQAKLQTTVLASPQLVSITFAPLCISIPALFPLRFTKIPTFGLSLFCSMILEAATNT